eukprot:m.1300332 g.1300332  ORF g.1300332 m.1300332 type:complete len:148 (-) comp24802_c1_seq18:2275-2718(-)
MKRCRNIDRLSRCSATRSTGVLQRDYALSTYPRCPVPGGPIWEDNCIHTVERTDFPFMGYTLRLDAWRYTEFVEWDGDTLTPQWDRVHSRELYYHGNDTSVGPDNWELADFYEDVNLVTTVNSSFLSVLSQKLRAAAGTGDAMDSHH